MSQIDKLNYMPILMWFVLLFVLFYVLIFSFTLPLIYTMMQIRDRLYRVSGENFNQLKIKAAFTVAYTHSSNAVKRVVNFII